MARIYYNKEKLSGEPIESNVINVELFDYIFNNTNANKFELQDIQKSSFFGFIKSKTKVFKNVLLRRDGIDYESKGSTFFLPTSIIFYDVYDYNFPSEFYFIAKIGNQIELRKCNGGKDIEWFHIPELHQPTDDPKILKKIENTLREVKKLVKLLIISKLNWNVRKRN